MSLAFVRKHLTAHLQNPRFLRNSGLLLLANAIGGGLALARTPLVAWLVPKEQIGMLAILSAWLPLVQLASIPGLDNASYHYISKGQLWAYHLNVVTRLRWSILSAVVLIGMGLLWRSDSEPALFWLFIVAGLTYPVTIGLTANGGTLAARENFVGVFWYRIGESVVDFVGIIPLLLAAWGAYSVVVYYLSNQLALAAMQLALVVWLWRSLTRDNAPPATTDKSDSGPYEGTDAGADNGDSRSMIRYGLHQTGIAAISVLQARADALLVSSFFPLTVMADYSIALWMQGQLKQLWIVYVSIRYPPLARIPPLARWRRIVIEAGAVTVLYAGAGVVMAFAAAWFVPRFLPPTYTGSLPYFYWLIAIFVVTVPGLFTELYFRMEQDVKNQVVLRAVGSVIGIALPAALMFVGSIDGILVGRLISGIAYSVLGVWLAVRYIRALSA
jgi:O-antigen/teichoic acid export membrane protein